MKLYADERPKVGDRPAFLALPMVAVPMPYVIPGAGPTVEIMIMLPRGEGAYSWSTTTVHETDVEKWLRGFREDPEAALKTTFHWEPPAAHASLQRVADDDSPLDLGALE